MIDFNKLLVGEAGFLEKHTGIPLSQLEEELKSPTQPVIPLVEAMTVITARREGRPTFTLDDARAMTLDEATELCGFDTEAAADVEGSEPDPHPFADAQ